MAEQFDLVVLGCGSGGSSCADRSLGYGKKVCLIDRGVTYVNGKRIGSGHGGTCVNVGCVPKKLMFEAAHLREMLVGSSELATGFGLTVDVKFDWSVLRRHRDEHVQEINTGFQEWKQPNLTQLTGNARFLDAKTVEVVALDGTTSSVTADHILIATGGNPNPCDVPGGELAISSNEFFDAAAQPRTAAVLGAGYVAVEMAGILHALGTETSLIFRGDSVLRTGYDAFVTDILMSELRRHGPTLLPNSHLARLHKVEGGTVVTLTDGRELGPFDMVLWATGRNPASDQLALSAAGVATNRTGHVLTDAFENTNVPGVYALGDVSSTGWDLTPVAVAAGRRLGDRLFGGYPGSRIFYETIPTVVFSHPPIGTVGLTQQQAEEKYGAQNVTVKENMFGSLKYSFNSKQHKVMTGLKLVLVGPLQRVAGLHCIGPMADEIIQGFAVAVRMGATLDDFEATVAIHPTIGEEFVTFGGWGLSNGRPRQTLKPPPPVTLDPVASAL